MDLLSVVQDTKDFYARVGPSFSSTRKSYWPGWYKLLPYIPSGSISDLACGNGRFYGFLKENSPHPFTYIGFDTNQLFLSEAREKYEGATFIEKDVLLGIKSIPRCDLVVVFGITHHIPDESFRKSWFRSLADCVKPGGKIIISFWNFQNDPRFKKARQVSDTDYYLKFSNSEKERYFHLYTDDEINQLLKPYKCLDTIVADGRSNMLNTYYVLSLK